MEILNLCLFLQESPALDSTVVLEETAEGFLSITDQRFAHTETVWTVTSKNSGVNTRLQLFTATKGERVVYRVKWRGGGSLTVRTL